MKIGKYLFCGLVSLQAALISTHTQGLTLGCVNDTFGGVTKTAIAAATISSLDRFFYDALFMFSIATDVDDLQGPYSTITSADPTYPVAIELIVHWLDEPTNISVWDLDSDIVLGGSFIPPFVIDDECSGSGYLYIP